MLDCEQSPAFLCKVTARETYNMRAAIKVGYPPAVCRLYSTWVERDKWVPCLRKQRQGRGLNLGPQDPEFEMLTARPPTSSQLISTSSFRPVLLFEQMSRVKITRGCHWLRTESIKPRVSQIPVYVHVNTLAIAMSRASNWTSRSTVFVCEMDLELKFLLVFEFERATLVPSPIQSTLALRTRTSSPPANRIKEWLKQTPAIKDSRYYCFFFFSPSWLT